MTVLRLDQIDAALINDICQGQWPESQTLEFKREWYSSSEKDRDEMLKDICAMANTDGGILLYGIEQQNGKAFSTSPIRGVNASDLVAQLGKRLAALVKPSAPRLRYSEIEVEGGFVLAIKVERSLTGPYCYGLNNGDSKFVKRIVEGTAQMSYEDIRSAFNAEGQVLEAARAFIRQRIGLFKSDEAPVVYGEGSAVVIHLVPLSSFSSTQAVDLSVIDLSATGKLRLVGEPSKAKPNIDGLRLSPGNALHRLDGQVQIFRRGSIEYSASVGPKAYLDHGHLTPSTVLDWDLMQQVFNAVHCVIESVRLLRIEGPCVLACSLLTSRGAVLSSDPPKSLNHFLVSDRAQMEMPALFIEDPAELSLLNTSREILNFLWQGFGALSCWMFNQDGTLQSNPRGNRRRDVAEFLGIQEINLEAVADPAQSPT